MGQLALVTGTSECSDVRLVNSNSTRGIQCSVIRSDDPSNFYDKNGHYFVPSQTAAGFLMDGGFTTGQGRAYRSTRYPQPVVNFSCTTTEFGSGTSLNQTFLENTRFTFANQTYSVSLAPLFSVDDVDLSTDSTDSMLRPFWIEDPQGDGARHSILLAKFEWYTSTVTWGNGQPPQGEGVYHFRGETCSLDAFWYNTTASRATDNVLSGVIMPDALDETSEIVGNEPIPIDVAWAQKMTDLLESYTPRIQHPDNIADFYAMVLSLGLSDISPEPQGEQLSTSSPNSLTQEQQAAVDAAIDDGKFSQYDEIMTSTDWTSLDGLFVQQTPLRKAGYGYNADSTTVQLSMAILGLYSLIAIAYLGITCVSGQTSRSWDSVGELLMLGLNSKRPSFLGRTSAGVERLNTYRQQVFVLVNEDDGLELVFEKDPENSKSLYRRVSANMPY